MTAPSGVLVIDKPRGITSHDVVARVRKRLKTREVGHAGTLDPMATGVLVVAVGEATKLVPYLTSEEKAYDAEVTFGRSTDTLDAEGVTTRESEVPADLTAKLEAALAAERVRTEQVPPAYSAIHVDGERAHERARRGQAVELAARPVHVLALDLRSCAEARAAIALRVSKGYYVRSLARDLGERLGVASHLSALRRTASGSFTLEGACSLDDEALDTKLLPVTAAATRALPSLHLADEDVVHARHGRPLSLAASVTPGIYAWLGPDGALVAIGRCEAGAGTSDASPPERIGRVMRGFR